MPDDKQNQQQARLQKRIDRLQQEWDLSDEKLRLMRRQRITETRNEEKFRLQEAIDQAQMEQDEIEQQLMDLYEQLASAQSGQLVGKLKTAVRRPDLRRMASNPLLLTVMALVHTHRGELPGNAHCSTKTPSIFCYSTGINATAAIQHSC
jgi:hypothetical protein